MSTQAVLNFTPAQASREAAERIKPDSKSLRAQIVNHIRVQGEYGATCFECEEALHIKHQTCSARIRDLRDDGLIEASGKSRKTSSGCNAVVYRVAEVNA